MRNNSESSDGSLSRRRTKADLQADGKALLDAIDSFMIPVMAGKRCSLYDPSGQGIYQLEDLAAEALMTSWTCLHVAGVKVSIWRCTVTRKDLHFLSSLHLVVFACRFDAVFNSGDFLHYQSNTLDLFRGVFVYQLPQHAVVPVHHVA